MNEQDRLSEHDIETLQRVEDLLAAQHTAANGATEVSILLANTVPQADHAFQSQLEAQLVAKLNGKRVQKSQEDSPIASRNIRPATLLKRAPFARHTPFNQAAGRFGSVLVGATMVAALVLALAFLLQSRRGDISVISTEGTATANALATQTAVSSNLTPDSTVTIKTSLLPVSVVVWSPDGRSSTSTMAWSGDGRTLASAAPNGIVTFWNAATGEKLREIDTSATGSLRGIKWSPDGGMLATYSASETSGWGFVDLWDPTTGEKLHSFTEREGRITSMDWSPDSSMLAWTEGWNIRLWDKATESTLPKPQPTWPAAITDLGIELNMTTNIDWSPDGTRLATSQSNIVKIWDPRSGQELAALQQSYIASRIDWSKDGSMLAVLVPSNPEALKSVQHDSLVLWDTASNQQIDTPVVKGTVTSISWLPRGLVLAMSVVNDKTADDYVAIYDAVTGQLTRITDGMATELAWSPDNQTLAIANSTDGIITLRNAWADPQIAASPTPRGPSSPTASVHPLTPVSHPPEQPGPAPACGLIWSLVPSESQGVLQDVEAISKDDVWAVGHTSVWPLGYVGGDPSANYPPSKTLIQHWNGERWSIVPSPNVGSSDNRLYGVAALSSNDVWVVGQYGDYNALKTLTMHWDGNAWEVIASPDIGTTNELRDIVAISANDVWAVGISRQTCGDSPCTSQTLILHWDGQRWSIVDSRIAGESSALSGVAATSANDIWAVGSYTVTDPVDQYRRSRPLLLHWNGKAWTQFDGPAIGGLNSVTAISPDDAWAIGGIWSGDPETESLLLHWDGKAWTEALGSRMQMGTGGGLRAITATATDDVWIVGGGPSPLIQHWDGKTWRRMATPTRSDPVMGGLFGVAAVGPGEIWAVGGQDTPGWPVANEESMILHYANVPCPAGTAQPSITSSAALTPTITGECTPGWTVVNSPNVDQRTKPSNELTDIAVISATDIWVVGSADQSALTMHWNGKDWSVIPAPGFGFSRVAAVATDDVWAIGAGDTNMAHWDGTAWKAVPVPMPSDSKSSSVLQGIDAVSANDVWAVGYYQSWNGEEFLGEVTLTVHWNGKEWSVIPSPNISPGNDPLRTTAINHLWAVTAISANDVWAVGTSAGRTLTMHWNGKEWSIVPTPDTQDNDYLISVVATSANDVWATGTSETTGFPREISSLIIHWDGARWNLMPSVDLGQGALSDVASASKNDAWAVGSSYNPDNGKAQTVTMHWDGKQWIIVPSPSPGQHHNHLAGIAVAPNGEVWAVGSTLSETLVLLYTQVPCATPTAKLNP